MNNALYWNVHFTMNLEMTIETYYITNPSACNFIKIMRNKNTVKISEMAIFTYNIF